MAVKISGVPTPYNAPSGGIVAPQISLCKPSNLSPRAAFVDIDWSKYTSGIVSIDLGTISPGQSVDMIKSVFVDNIGLVLPITVYFPDTQFEMTCQANATECQNVLTGNLQAQIVLGSTSISLSSLKAATTRVWFSNAPAEAFINQVSPTTIQQFEVSNYIGKPQAFAPKPAGELRGLFSYNFNTAVFTDILAGIVINPVNMLVNYPNIVTAAAGVYLVITDMKVWTESLYLSQAGAFGYTSIPYTLFIGPSVANPQGSYFTWTLPFRMTDDFYDYHLIQDSHNLFTQINPYSANLQFGASVSSGPNPAGSFNGMFFIDMQFTYISQI